MVTYNLNDLMVGYANYQVIQIIPKRLAGRC